MNPLCARNGNLFQFMAKLNFLQPLLQSLASHDPSEIIYCLNINFENVLPKFVENIVFPGLWTGEKKKKKKNAFKNVKIL